MAVAPVSPAFGETTRGLESGLTDLRHAQESFDSQLTRLEQSLQGLQQAVATAQTCAAAPAALAAPAPAPQPEIRTVVNTARMPWYFWLGSAAFAFASAAAAFAFGRRRMFFNRLVETDEHLEPMRATAANGVHRSKSTPMTAVAPALRPVTDPRPKPPVEQTAPPPKNASRDRTFDTQTIPPASSVEVEPDSTPAKTPAGLSRDLQHEMDRALDKTRSIFTDVDRFIALGRIRNALSLLQDQVQKDPKDRQIWIKLMAVYRQETRVVELEKTAQEFRKLFPSAH